jgi:hypothetical protein
MKDPPALVTWSQNGIIMSAHPRKLLNNAVSHCEGVQVGGGATRVGNGFCKIVDEDGDALIFETPYTGVDIEVKLVRGTGKWQDVSGALHSTRIVRSADGKGAMPLTYQGCRLEKGEVEMRK